MSIKFGNAQLWVRDQNEALEFYTKKLGWEVRSDLSMPEMGGLDKPCGDLIAPFWLEISAAKKKREASISLLSRTHIG